MAAAGVALALALGGCAADAQRAGNDAATGSADTVTRFLRSDVVRPRSTPLAQLQRVQRWLTAAAGPVTVSSPDLSGLGDPTLRILARTGERVDIVVYEYGETPAVEGRNGALGHVCRRYTVDAASRLVADDLSCPAGIPDRPD